MYGVKLERLRQEKQRVKLAAASDHRLPSRQANQREHDDLQVLPWVNLTAIPATSLPRAEKAYKISPLFA